MNKEERVKISNAVSLAFDRALEQCDVSENYWPEDRTEAHCELEEDVWDKIWEAVNEVCREYKGAAND